jgi:hypothetical protein
MTLNTVKLQKNQRFKNIYVILSSTLPNHAA